MSWGMMGMGGQLGWGININNDQEAAGWRKGPWTAEEDRLLTEYVKLHGEGRWNSVARLAGIYIYILIYWSLKYIYIFKKNLQISLVLIALADAVFLLLGVCVCRTEKEWEELQTEVGELFEARPQERADNPT